MNDYDLYLLKYLISILGILLFSIVSPVVQNAQKHLLHVKIMRD